MRHSVYTVGIDISSDHFTTTVMNAEFQVTGTTTEFQNTPEGFSELLTWFRKLEVVPESAVVCMEATGVYGEHLCFFLASKHFHIAVEPPLKVKRSFHLSSHKNDTVDSRQIAEYAHRFFDELSFWQPNTDIIEQIKTLLTTRENLTAQLIANQNAVKTLARKHVRTQMAEQTHTDLIVHLKQKLETIDKEIKRLIDQDVSLRTMSSLLQSIPGVGLLLTAHLVCLTRGFTKPITAKQLAAYAGICPYERTSGSSLQKKPTSRGFGPSTLRKLLYLASLSVRTHTKQFQLYFLRKVAEGKSKRLVLNNIANKLSRIICAVIKNKKQFITNYCSVNPLLLKNA